MARSLKVQKLINYGKHLPDAIAANIKYGFPGRKIKVIGVTGTDGKTTTVNMIYRILKDAGKKVSMLSTINAVVAGKSYDTGFHVTSPAAADIQKYLKMAVDHGDEYMVLEITSHALDQFRSWGIPIAIAVVTNVTHEHLDYHKTFANYLKAKAKLIQQAHMVILNKDDDSFEQLKKYSANGVKTTSLQQPADLNLKKLPLRLKIPGNYNKSNALQAGLVGLTLGLDLSAIKSSLERFDNLKGRMEQVSDLAGRLKKRGLKVVVDFAHTPHALDQALQALRVETKGKIIAVFGAASQRDVAKRPMMGEIAARKADLTVLTDEDPRFENSQDIIDQIAKGYYKVKKDHLYQQPDRYEAIRMALGLAKTGDTVAIFGKGHEQSMNYSGKELAWSDSDAVLKAVKEDGKSS